MKIIATVMLLILGEGSMIALEDMNFGEDTKGNRSELNVIEKNFDNPDDSSKPSGFWWWLNSLVDKESITRSLEELSSMGLGEVMLVCSSNWGVSEEKQLQERGPEFLSEEWLELFRYTLDEAARLGLKVGVNFCASGWTIGGPWITPEMNGRWFVQSKISLKGPMVYEGKLPLPEPRDGYKPPHFLNVGIQMEWPLEKMDYRDNAIVAFRDPGIGSCFDDDRVQILDAKTNRKDGDVFMTPEMVMEPTITPFNVRSIDRPVSLTDIVDVTSCLQKDGSFKWKVPEGNWTIVRTGHVATGAPLMCILPEMKNGALAIDWLNEASVDTMFKYMGDLLIEAAGEKHVGKTLAYFHTDSYEDGYPNWTDRILEKFEEYRGYDPKPYLPVFSGYIVGSAEISDRFLYDYRKTAADLFADGALKRLSDSCTRYGMFYEGETGGPSWSGTVCIDALKNLGRTDRPMGEFWSDLTFVSRHDQNYVCKQTATAAHVYGKKIACAESFTDNSHWTESPEYLKPVADRAFCEGINKISFHTLTLQRLKDGKPGYEYGAGTHFNPNLTWWEMGAADWVSYLSRCSAMLQGGMFVADVLFYNGDWAPNLVKPKHVDPSLGIGYDYDVCNAEVLLERVNTQNGEIVLPDGMRYRILVLPEKDFMPVEVLMKIKELVKEGATVIGPKPVRDPGLKNFPQCDEQVKSIALDLWGNIDGKSICENKYGKGRIVWGKTIREVLKEMNIIPDFEVIKPDLKKFPDYPYITSRENEPGCFTRARTDVNLSLDGRLHRDSTFIDYIHRSLRDMEVYYVVNRKNKRECVNAMFRVEGGIPELWDPVSGSKRFLPEYLKQDGRYIIPLCFEPYDSYFIVFNKNHRVKGEILSPLRNFCETKNIFSLSESRWQVTFDKEWLYPKDEIIGMENTIILNSLYDLKDHSSFAVRHYSGIIKYETEFMFEGDPRRYDQLGIDLGDVSVMAQVTLNGVDLGTLWRAPFVTDISKVIKKGKNNLEIKVANLWQNRLVGDSFLPNEEQKTFTNMRVYDKTSSLQSSGLLGPVSIVEIKYGR